MGAPIVTQNAMVVGTDIHIVLVPTPGGPVPVPLPHIFSGQIQGATAATVFIGGLPVAVQDSVAVNNPPHIPTPPGASFQVPPKNQGKVLIASQTVFIGGKGVARVGDTVMECNDPSDMPTGTIVGPPTTVFAG